MDNKNLQYETDQLRKDKIIYASEAIVVNLVCLFVFIFPNQYFADNIRDIVNVLAFVIAVGYTLYMGVGNYLRLKKIIKLQDKLK